mmetsp:Transcript_45276/g.102256  ORF Transcript_45276/g.102256 Transcript_45276/m.102256 type:complete len:219 (+) Transcript_45276:383-1039(+)
MELYNTDSDDRRHIGNRFSYGGAPAAPPKGHYSGVGFGLSLRGGDYRGAYPSSGRGISPDYRPPYYRLRYEQIPMDPAAIFPTRARAVGWVDAPAKSEPLPQREWPGSKQAKPREVREVREVPDGVLFLWGEVFARFSRETAARPAGSTATQNTGWPPPGRTLDRDGWLRAALFVTNCGDPRRLDACFLACCDAPGGLMGPAAYLRACTALHNDKGFP